MLNRFVTKNIETQYQNVFNVKIIRMTILQFIFVQYHAEIEQNLTLTFSLIDRIS